MLGPQTAWLYTKFLQHDASALRGYNFANPTSAVARDQANALQLGIWSGMGYSPTDIMSLSGWNAAYISGTLSPLLNPWMNNFQFDLDHNLWSGTGNVQIMSLRNFVVDPNGPVTLADGRHIRLTEYIQDQLISHTPELPTFYSGCTVAGCAVLWGIVSIIRKRASAAGTT